MDNIRSLEEKYLKAKIAYYEGNPIMSDSEFDALESHLKSIGSKAPHQVGSKRKDFDFSHPTKMLSLAKIQTERAEGGTNYMEEEFRKWYFKRREIAGPSELRVSPKFDGNAINCIYQGTKLVNVLTRGDGISGKDITDRIKLLIENELALAKLEVTEEDIIEIRCEVVIDVNLFDKKYAGEFANARNYVAGVIGKDEYDLQKVSELTVIPLHYLVNGRNVWPGHFQINPVMGASYEEPMLSREYKEKMKHYEDVRKNRDIPYQLDGIVITFPYMRREKLGENDHDPEWAIAIKFVPEEIITRVTGIDWKVSKRGEIMPTLELEPVFLDGSTVGRASGYNLGYLVKNGIAPGAKVAIAKAGDIIPEVQRVVVPSIMRLSDANMWKCPACGSDTEVADQIHLMCTNEYCEGKIAKQMSVAVKVLDIHGVGEKTISKFAKKFGNFFESMKWILTQPDALGEFGFEIGSRSHQNFINAFKNIKSLTYEQVIQMLGYENVGKKLSIQLSRDHAGLDYDYSHLEKALVAKLRSPEVSNYIKEVVKGLEDLGISIDRPKDESQNGTSIGVCLTGSPKGAGFATKKEFLDKFTHLFEVSLSDKNCKYLITDSLESTSSKMKTAQKKGIEIKTYKDF